MDIFIYFLSVYFVHLESYGDGYKLCHKEIVVME